MSGCTECRELISAYLDGETSPDESARMRAHLATCEACRDTLEVYRRIGATVRSMPVVLAPADLTSAIYSQTIDSESRKLFLITGRMRYPLAAAAAALLIFVVAGYMLFGGYQRSIDPTIASFEPEQNQEWPIQKPVEITFNKAMDRASVESALAIVPAGEDERLDKIWDGNTLLIGGNQALRPGTGYTVNITTDARDEWGNRLDRTFELTFKTGPTVALRTPTPDAGAVTPTATEQPPEPTPSATAEPMARSTTVAVVETEPPTGPTEPGVPTTTTNDDRAGGGGGGVVPTPTPTPPPTPRREPTPTPDRDVDDVDPTPSPTASPTPTAVVSEPTVTPTPESAGPTATEVAPTATPTPISTATVTPPAPTATATPDTIPVVGVLGDVYWSNSTVQERLGEPLEIAGATNGMSLGFQNGTMLYRSDFDSVYVLISGLSSWEQRDNPGQPYPEFALGTDSGTWVPGGIFGALWESEPYLQDNLRLAVAPAESSFDATVQTFENGVMFSAPGVVYIFYTGDGTWEFWPAAE